MLDCGFDKLPGAALEKVLMRLIGYQRGEFYVRPFRKPENPRLDRDIQVLLAGPSA